MVLARQNSKDLDDILLDIVKYARESRDHAGEVSYTMLHGLQASRR